MQATAGLPVIDLGADEASIARAMRTACLETGFFYVVGHGVDEALFRALDQEARAFFALPVEQKLEVAMARGGRAWRGYFPVGGELTSGLPDQKEGLYLGQELPADHPLVLRGLPMHGANLWPAQTPGLRPAVLAWLDALTDLGQRVLELLALSLELPRGHFRQHLTAQPLALFRVFRYPPAHEGWGVGEHTDYGLLTLLRQDDVGGLQVRSQQGWLDAPPIPGSFVCNIGDMLERLTAGRYRSTPHRVQHSRGQERFSYPFFFDPGWDALVRAIEAGLSIKVPFVATIVGEGGSGGAIALAAADRVLILEHAIYSVISPEGCASILWKSAEKASDAAQAMGITAERLKELGFVDSLIKEPLGGAHRHPVTTAERVKEALTASLDRLQALDIHEVLLPFGADVAMSQPARQLWRR